MRYPSDRLLDVSIVKDPRAFAVLEEEWEDLHRNSPLATPFQSWAWLYSWWDFYGESYELRLVTMRDDTGLLVGLAPLMLERRGGVGRLLFLGTGSAGAGSPYDHDLLARRGWETRVSAVGRRTLERMDGWHVADLQQLRPEAAAWGIFEDWAGPRARIWQDNFSVIDVRPWDEILMSLRKSRRSAARQALRRAEADGVRAELAGADDAEPAARRLVALSRELWRERWRETSPELWAQRYESFLRTVARRMTVRGWGGISEFRRDGEAIISHFLVFGGDFVQVYTLGASRQALRRYQYGSLLIWDGVNAARGRNSRLFDLGRGREPYKLRWRSGVIPTHRMILGRSRIPWSLYAGYHLLRSTAKRYAYSEDVPQWVRGAVDRYRVLRYTLARHVKEWGRRS